MLRLLRHGRGLAHWPIAFPNDAIHVAVHLRSRHGATVDVTSAHVPVSLRPLVLGVELDREPDDRFGRDEALSLRMSDAPTGIELADVRLRAIGAISTAGRDLRLFEARSCHNRCASGPVRWWRYALAWRHAANAPRRGDRLCMSAADLRALNVYYIVPRPVYAVSVRHAGRTNIFPMDLVGRLPSGAFTLALRATSPAIELIEGAGRVAMSGAPASRLADVYALGRHHHEATVNIDELPFEISESPDFGLPIMAGASIVRELSVRAVHRVGSHVVFVCAVEGERGEPRTMIAHASAMYVEWLGRRGETIQVLS